MSDIDSFEQVGTEVLVAHRMGYWWPVVELDEITSEMIHEADAYLDEYLRKRDEAVWDAGSRAQVEFYRAAYNPTVPVTEALDLTPANPYTQK